MKRMLLCLLAFLFCLCGCKGETPAEINPPAELNPLDLPTADDVASATTVDGSFSYTPNQEALTAAVDARIAKLLSPLMVEVAEPATLAATLRVRYFGVLQEALSPAEVREGILQTEVQGEARLAVSADPDALIGVEAGDTDIALGVLDPAIFSLADYKNHTILFHIEVLAVYRAPQSLAEIPNLEKVTGYATAEELQAALTAEERGKLLWQDALARISVGEIPADTLSAVATEFVEAHRNRYRASGTNVSFSTWLATLTPYKNEAELTAGADGAAAEICKNLFAACAVLDGIGGRETLPDYLTGAAPLATANGYSTVRHYTWKIGGSAIGWQDVIRVHCEKILSVKTA